MLATHLKHTGLFQRDVIVSRNSLLGYPGVDWDAQVQGVAGEVAHDHLFARPRQEEQVDVTYGGTPPSFKGEVASIEHLCVHLRIVRGRCLSGDSTGQTLISANTAAAEHLTVGSTLTATATNGVAIRLRVVGVYRQSRPAGRSGSRGTCSSSASASGNQASAGRRLVRDFGRALVPAAASAADAVGECGAAPEMSATTTSANCGRRSRRGMPRSRTSPAGRRRAACLVASMTTGLRPSSTRQIKRHRSLARW